MRERKIVYLVNPISGGGKKDEFVQYLKKYNQQNKVNFEVLPTEPKGHYDVLADYIESNGVTDVVIIGGDGTVNQAISGLHKCKVHFGIIPYGSGNGLAYSAHIPKKQTEALSLIFAGQPRWVDAFTINNHFSCNLSGIGFDAQVAHDFSLKANRGLLTYTQQSILNYFKAHPYQFEVTVEGFSFFTEAFFISIANSNQFGNNVTIAPHASLNDGLLDIVIVQKMNKAKLPFAILKQIRGNNKLQELVEDMTKKNIIYFQTSSLQIKNIKLAPLHVDGEPMHTDHDFNIQIHKNYFQLIQHV
ncbi:MAG: diacylglycerol/lipid kinase family protein [Chitinophagaceae bacterium]